MPPRPEDKYRNKSNLSDLKLHLHEVIFEADTVAGKSFDILLLIFIVCSVLVVMLESVVSLNIEYGQYFRFLEWFFTILFTVEYFLRLYTIGKPVKYAFSFFGIIDVLSIVPTYLSLFVVGSQSLIVIRSLRLLRVFRVLKLARFLGEAEQLGNALKASRHKIIVFLVSIITMVVILGTMMYLIEDPENGFTSIPRSIYWAIVTLTTVGYGDIAPQTVIGQFFASTIMILGYSVLAVPTGIVSAEMVRANKETVSSQVCPECAREGHDFDATYCKYCGTKLN